jgi:hypothetical protein
LPRSADGCASSPSLAAQKPNRCGRLSPPQVLNRRLLAFAVLYRIGAPDKDSNL